MPETVAYHKCCHNSDSLPTFKIHIKWEVMSQSNSCSCIHHQKRKNITSMIYCTDNEHCCKTLQHISRESHKSCFQSHNTQCIRRTGISASCFSYINMMHLSDQITALQKSAGISDHQTDNTFHSTDPFPFSHG